MTENEHIDELNELIKICKAMSVPFNEIFFIFDIKKIVNGISI